MSTSERSKDFKSRNHLFIIKEKPIPCARARVTKWGAFDPQKDKKNWLKAILREQMIERGLDIIFRPVHVEILFSFEVPKSWPKWKQKMALESHVMHIFKPDIDNTAKFCLDAMNKTVIEDDSQITCLNLKKQYSEHSSTVIEVYEIHMLPDEEIKDLYKKRFK